MKKLLIPVAMFALVACDNDTAQKYEVDFQNMGVVGYSDAQGEAMYTIDEKERKTTLSASGMKANTEYVAHYHVMGDKSTVACQSGGQTVNGKIGDKTFMSNAEGMLTISGMADESNLNGAAYINIHEAADLGIVPLCADLSKVAEVE